MNLKSLLFIICSVICSSCAKENNGTICNTSDPISDLTWLNKAVMELQELEENDGVKQYFYVVQAEYDNQTVFIFDNCCPFCNTIISVINCEGVQLGLLGTDISSDAITNRKIIYKPLNLACDI